MNKKSLGQINFEKVQHGNEFKWVDCTDEEKEWWENGAKAVERAVLRRERAKGNFSKISDDRLRASLQLQRAYQKSVGIIEKKKKK